MMATMFKPSKLISGLSDFTDWVEEVGKQFRKPTDLGEQEVPWFRGAGNSSYELVPGLYRTEAGHGKFADDELRTEFLRRALPMVAERVPRDEWEWYCLMQHYRAPTRLLDWTDSALVALYFALTSRMEDKSLPESPRPAVWAINPFTLNRRSGVGGGAVYTSNDKAREYLPPPYSEDKRIPQFPIAVDPALTHQRMLVQHSHFTVHGSDFRSIDAMQAELGLQADLIQVVIDLDLEGIRYLLQHMAWMGITETTVFPDLEGLARELRLEYDLERP
jgi:hypothetical protein